jgi:hypothetical protein
VELCQILPKIWNYVKFCQKYGIMPSFAKHMELCFSFAKNMKLYEILPKLYSYASVLPNSWNYVKFCQKYEII